MLLPGQGGTIRAYVDFDPLVVSHLDALVANGQDEIVVMAADVRDRDAVLCAPDLVGHIDLSQPACLVMGAVLHFLDAVAAADLAASYARLLAPGSYVVITVGRGDGEVADRFFSMYRAAARMHSHSLDQFATFFEGLEIVPPGLLLASNGSRICGTCGPSRSVPARCWWASARCPAPAETVGPVQVRDEEVLFAERTLVPAVGHRYREQERSRLEPAPGAAQGGAAEDVSRPDPAS